MTLAVFFFRQEIIENPAFSDFVMYLYFISLLILFAFGAHGFVMVYHYMKQRGICKHSTASEGNARCDDTAPACSMNCMLPIG